jgi:hypothetical protein
MRYGPVKRAKDWRQLHVLVAGFFTAATLCTLYSHFASEIEQKNVPSNYYVRDALDLYLYWMVKYPDMRTMTASYGVPRSVFHRFIGFFSRYSAGLSTVWITSGTLGKFDTFCWLHYLVLCRRKRISCQ